MASSNRAPPAYGNQGVPQSFGFTNNDSGMRPDMPAANPQVYSSQPEDTARPDAHAFDYKAIMQQMGLPGPMADMASSAMRQRPPAGAGYGGGQSIMGNPSRNAMLLSGFGNAPRRWT